MKLNLLIFGLLLTGIVYAGTPSVNGTVILYGIPLIILAGLIGVPYLIKFIKKRKAAKTENLKIDLEESKNPNELGDN
ncbi:MAG: hypothetical protein ACKVQB_00480 [Bacteroidia bacterium]